MIGAEDRWASILLGGAGGSLGRVRLSSARLFAALELEEPSWWGPRPLGPISGRFRPKRAIPALGELSICFDDTSMEISVRLADAVSGLRPPDSSMRLMPVFGETRLEDSEGEDLEECSELRELRSKLRWLEEDEVEERRGLVVRRDSGEGCVEESASSTSNDRFSAGGKKRPFIVRHVTESTVTFGSKLFVLNTCHAEVTLYKAKRLMKQSILPDLTRFR